ncbi:MAG: hypothetical protein EOM11_10165 [Erysipelotrichia bacterium]|nr:hypothetical protein [Erysipelotrichia bacterium]
MKHSNNTVLNNLRELSKLHFPEIQVLKQVEIAKDTLSFAYRFPVEKVFKKWLGGNMMVISKNTKFI